VPQPRKVVAWIDFGDVHYGLTVSEPAIAAAYAILGKKITGGGAAIVAGYHGASLDEADRPFFLH